MPRGKFFLGGHTRSDIARIRRYTLEKWGNDQWLSYKSALFNTFQSLADNPEIGLLLEEVSPEAYRFPVKDYVLYYLKRKSDIVFVGVLSNKMAPEKHAQRQQELATR